MPLLAALTTALTLLAAPGLSRDPPDAPLPSDGGDLWVVSARTDTLYVAFVHPIAFQPGKVKAITVASINRTPRLNAEGRLQSQDYMGLIIDCQKRTAVMTGYAAWDETQTPMVIYGGLPDVTPIQPNTLPDIGAKVMCEGAGRKTTDYLYRVLDRWRATGEPF